MAKEAGAKVLGGLSMVVYVCAVSFRLMLDKEPPLEVMFQAARKAAEQYT
jgi:shikimate 5-dehydrogenase